MTRHTVSRRLSFGFRQFLRDLALVPAMWRRAVDRERAALDPAPRITSWWNMLEETRSALAAAPDQGLVEDPGDGALRILPDRSPVEVCGGGRRPGDDVEGG